MKILLLTRTFLQGGGLFLVLTSCATLNFRQGVALRNPATYARGDLGEVDRPRAYGVYGLMTFVPPNIEISLDESPKNFVLAVGPDLFILPLPVIPWPVGIVQALRSSKASAVDKNNLKIIMRFGWNNRYGGPYVFNTKDIKIVSDGKEIFPSSFHATCNKGCAAHGGSYEENGDELTVWTSIRLPVPGPQIELEFPLTYNEISTAQLIIGPIKSPQGRIHLPPTTVLNKSHVVIESHFLSP